MSVFNLSAAATDKLFLEYVLPGMNVQFLENTIVYDRWGETHKDEVLGKYAVFKCNTASPKSARPSSSSTFPTAKQGVYKEFQLYMKRSMYATLQFDGLAQACARGKGAVIEAVKSEVSGITMQMGNKLNRQYWGDGSGRLARLSALSNNSTTVTIGGAGNLFGLDSNKYTNPAMYLDEGMDIDIYIGGVLQAEEVEISTITDNNNGTATLTMASAVTASDDAYIFDHDTYGAAHGAGVGVPMGIFGIVNTTDPYIGETQVYFQGQQRSANVWAQAQVVDNSSNPISDLKLIELIMACEKYGRISVLLMNEIIWRTWYEIMKVDRTLPNEKMLWAGTEGLVFYGGRKGKIPIIFDADCPDMSVFAIDDSVLHVYSPLDKGLAFMPGDNGILSRIQGKDEWVANLIKYDNFGTPKPRALGKLSNVKHASS